MDRGNMDSEGFFKLWSVSTKFAREMKLYAWSRPIIHDMLSYNDTLSTLINTNPLTDSNVKLYGSRGEGIWYPFEIADNRDMDIVYVYPKTLAVEIASENDVNDQEMYVYLVDREDSIPGYCRLRQVHRGSSLWSILHITKEFNGIKYLLSTWPRRVTEKLVMDIQDILSSFIGKTLGSPDFGFGPRAESGPSVSTEISGWPCSYNITKLDNVFVINHPKWPSCASEWRDRIRYYGWPSQQRISNITNKGISLAPVGSIQSELGDVQWRYSFNEAERELVRSFNSTQANCYVLLKMVASEYITPHFDNDVISSYHIKTLMFWAIEQTYPTLWVSGNLVELVFRILNVLLDCVSKLSCPSYFIPDENLFAGKITAVNREHVSQIILKVINEGWVSLTKLKQFAKKEDFVQSLYEDNDIVDVRKLEEMRLCDEQITMIVYFWSSYSTLLCINHLLYPISCCSLIETDKMNEKFNEVINKLLQIIHLSDDDKTKEVIRNILAFVRCIYGTHFLSLSRCPSLERRDNCIMEKIGLVYTSYACKSNLVECIAKHANYTYMTGDFQSTIEAANQLFDRYARFPLRPRGFPRSHQAHFDSYVATAFNCVSYGRNHYDLFDKHCFLGWIIFLKNEIYALPGDARVELFYVIRTGNQLQTICRNWFGLCPFVYVAYLAFLINISRVFEYKAKVYLKIMESICGNSNSYESSSINLLGACYIKLGQHEKAMQMFRLSMKRQREETNGAIWHVERFLWRKLRDRWTETS